MIAIMIQKVKRLKRLLGFEAIVGDLSAFFSVILVKHAANS